MHNIYVKGKIIYLPDMKHELYSEKYVLSEKLIVISFWKKEGNTFEKEKGKKTKQQEKEIYLQLYAVSNFT